ISPGIGQGAFFYFVAKTKPAGICSVEKTTESLTAAIYFLKLQEQQLSHAAQQPVFAGEVIELVPVNRKMPHTRVRPAVLAVHWRADQMRHDWRKADVVVAFHPHHLNATLRT